MNFQSLKLLVLSILLTKFLSLNFFANPSPPSKKHLKEEVDLLNDSLMIKLKQAADDTSTIKILNEIAWHYAPTKFDTSLKYADSALTLANQINWDKGIAHSLKNKGEALRYKGEVDEALTQYKLSLDKFININDDKGIISSKSNIGISYYMKSDFPNAFKFYQESLIKCQEINYEKGELQNISLIGALYFTFTYYDKALDYYQKALNIASRTNNIEEISIQKGNIGLTLVKIGKYNESITYLNEAYNYFISNDDYYNFTLISGNIGIAYAKLRRYQLANKYFRKSLELSQKINDLHGIATQNVNIGSLKLDQYFDSKGKENKKYLNSLLFEAEEYVQFSTKLYMKLNSFDDLKFSYGKLSEIYKEQENHSEALRYLELKKDIEDSLFSIQNKIKIAEIEVDQSLLFKDQEIANLSNEKVKNKLTTESLILIELVLVIGIVSIFIIYIQRRKKHMLLIENMKRRVQSEKDFRNDIDNLTDSGN